MWTAGQTLQRHAEGRTQRAQTIEVASLPSLLSARRVGLHTPPGTSSRIWVLDDETRQYDSPVQTYEPYISRVWFS